MVNAASSDRNLAMEEPFLPPKFSKAYLQEFEQWLLSRLEVFAGPRIEDGQEHVWQVVNAFLKECSEGLRTLTNSELLQVKSAIFKLGTQTSYMVGVRVSREVDTRLASWGWTPKEIHDFPGWAYRVALIKALVESGQIQHFSELLKAAQSYPLSETARQAIEFARTVGLKNLKPVYDGNGNLIQGETLDKEKERLRRLLVEALVEGTNAIKLARKMYGADKAVGIYRDFERVARTEMANCVHHGSFAADRISGKFTDNDLVFRIPRPQACKLCISLNIGLGGTPRLYKVKDLVEEATPLIRVSGRGAKRYRALIGVNHPNCTCSGWQKYWGAASDMQFHQFAARYIEAQARYRIELP